MKGIRATLSISRNVNRFKDEFPNLYYEFQLARRKKNYGVNSWVYVSDSTYNEYMLLVKKYLIVTKYPNNNREVMITTHNGGKFVGFYEGEKWKYRTGANTIVEVDGHVIKWEKLK